MSYFSSALSTALSEAGISQVDLCQSTGIGTSAMSKYVRGAIDVGSQVAQKIVVALPSPQNAQVLAGFLRDQTPRDLADLVAILPTGRLAEAAPDPIPGPDILSGQHRELIAYFARRIHDPVIYDMLASTRRAIEAE